MDFNRVAKKWQKRWEANKVFKVKEAAKKDKFYVLEMFPYPSGTGLHMGHAFNYTIGDIYARFKRMQGFNVLYPMGYDSFGLPAENAAIKAKIHPKKYTEATIKNFIKQQKLLGLSYDWSRLIKTSSPEYYRWNQYLFLKLMENNLVYRKESIVNWCAECDTVLANEQVHNGKCWRHKDTDVIEKSLEQWFIKTTAYSEELLKDIDKLDWPERIKIMQKNWIGKSRGTKVKFRIKDLDEEIEVFTTRPDTLYGVTFLVYSIHHPRVKELISGTKQEKNVIDFISSTPKQTQEAKEKEGVFTGRYAVHPLTGEEIPIYASNFVVADYATGVVMAVPAHDQRDFEFAKKYDLPIKMVVCPNYPKPVCKVLEKAYTKEGILVDSGKFTGIRSEKAKNEITAYLKQKKLGSEGLQYKLRDWLVSRQRYWGTPIPVIYCDSCGIVNVPEKDLPVKLPENVKFGKGNPLESNEKFLKTKCPKCKGEARRETDTMDTFFDSSWYFLRFIDPSNDKEPFNKKRQAQWMPVDWYIGGAEHACMHLIYARFFTKALRDLGFVNVDEPFKVLFNQGMLHKDGVVMAKSRGNVVLPEEFSKKYGIDTARLFLMSVASPDKDVEWSDTGAEGIYKFLNRLVSNVSKIKIGKSSARLESKINKTIKEVTEYIKDLKYNLAVIKIRGLFDYFALEKEIGKKDMESCIKIIAPFCPHIAEELWEKMGNKSFVSIQKWPSHNSSKINEKFEAEDKATNNVISDISKILSLLKGKSINKVYVYVLPKELDAYNKEEIERRVNKEVIISRVNDKDKHDPQNKAKKAKPGKPAIYLE